MMVRMAAGVIIVLLGSMSPAQSPPACKSVTRYGVSGCELLPDQSCPRRYHKQIVDPPNPQMTSPSFLMCVADKPQSKEQPPKTPPKSKR
jgi:hypothetical protein